MPAPSRSRRQRLVDAQALAVGPVGRHRVEGVADEDDPDSSGIVLAGLPVRIAGAVPALVAAPHDRAHLGEPVDRLEDPLAELGVHLDDLALFFRVSGPGLSRMLVGIPILPMSWKSAPSSSRFSVVPVEAQRLADA